MESPAWDESKYTFLKSAFTKMSPIFKDLPEWTASIVFVNCEKVADYNQIIVDVGDQNGNFPLTDHNTFKFNYTDDNEDLFTDRLAYFLDWVDQRIYISSKEEERKEWNTWFISTDQKIRVKGCEGYQEMIDE